MQWEYVKFVARDKFPELIRTPHPDQEHSLVKQRQREDAVNNDAVVGRALGRGRRSQWPN